MTESMEDVRVIIHVSLPLLFNHWQQTTGRRESNARRISLPLQPNPAVPYFHEMSFKLF